MKFSIKLVSGKYSTIFHKNTSKMNSYLRYLFKTESIMLVNIPGVHHVFIYADFIKLQHITLYL